MSDSEGEASSANSDSGDDTVGYGKPPKSGRFQKGRSGNPRGRPKGSKGLATLVKQQCSEKLQIKIDGKTRTVSIGQGLVMRIFREGLAGNKAASEQALRLLERFGIEDESEPEAYDVTLLTDTELDEYCRINAKMMGKEDEYRRDCALDKERRRSEHDRVWGEGSYDIAMARDPSEDGLDKL